MKYYPQVQALQGGDSIIPVIGQVVESITEGIYGKGIAEEQRKAEGLRLKREALKKDLTIPLTIGGSVIAAGLILYLISR